MRSKAAEAAADSSIHPKTVALNTSCQSGCSKTATLFHPALKRCSKVAFAAAATAAAAGEAAAAGASAAAAIATRAAVSSSRTARIGRGRAKSEVAGRRWAGKACWPVCFAGDGPAGEVQVAAKRIRPCGEATHECISNADGAPPPTPRSQPMPCA